MSKSGAISNVAVTENILKPELTSWPAGGHKLLKKPKIWKGVFENEVKGWPLLYIREVYISK